jgi:hypothetical protein
VFLVRSKKDQTVGFGINNRDALRVAAIWLVTFGCVEGISFSRYRQSEKLALGAAFIIVFISQAQKMRHNLAIVRGKRIESVRNALNFFPAITWAAPFCFRDAIRKPPTPSGAPGNSGIRPT